ncbi:MAG: cytochrome c biogenesis protein CcsA, partial [Planctomycetota bacterium]
IAVYGLVPWDSVKHRLRPSQRGANFDYYAAGQIPTQFGGRLMPLDAYARIALQTVSNRTKLPLYEEYKESTGIGAAPKEIIERAGGKSKLTALQWLMEVAIARPEIFDLPMFRIDAEVIRSELDLPTKKKFYSYAEIDRNRERVREIIAPLEFKSVKDFTFTERKMVELNGRLNTFRQVMMAFGLPTPRGGSEQAFAMLARDMQVVAESSAAAIVPPTDVEIQMQVDDPRWKPFSSAFFNHIVGQARRGQLDGASEMPPVIEGFSEMLNAYATDDPAQFNQSVDAILESTGEREIPALSSTTIALERWTTDRSPTTVAMILYLGAMVFGLIYFMAQRAPLRRAVWATLLIALAIHTTSLVCRMLITGRAPVINLYSAAVFIGWGMVVFGLIVERFYRYGIGNLLASFTGVLSLLVAYGLDKGDTMPVLQAVLDTQFWLATHVITVTLGYVATMVGGFFGIGYIIAGWIGSSDTRLKDLYRCCYGAACFGILFSFVGTVLGGLWADDSWGRFWGWDPKENGALLIVIWNALLLHARWDGMIKGRGFANLAIIGNIVTAWSMFGTNELGIGLHSYGFTEGTMVWLTCFFASQMAFVIADALVRFAGQKREAQTA